MTPAERMIYAAAWVQIGPTINALERAYAMVIAFRCAEDYAPDADPEVLAMYLQMRDGGEGEEEG